MRRMVGSPDLGVLFWVRNGEDGFGEPSRGGVDRVGWENFVMEWGVKR